MLAHRPQITGKKLSSAGPVALGAYSIRSFCEAHALSRAMYFKMKAMDEGPAEMEVGRRRMVSIEAAAAWRRRRQEAVLKAKAEPETASA